MGRKKFSKTPKCSGDVSHQDDGGYFREPGMTGDILEERESLSASTLAHPWHKYSQETSLFVDFTHIGGTLSKK
jgi:hypothetical protein